MRVIRFRFSGLSARLLINAHQAILAVLGLYVTAGVVNYGTGYRIKVTLVGPPEK
jgi:hypothetical protein